MSKFVMILCFVAISFLKKQIIFCYIGWEMDGEIRGSWYQEENLYKGVHSYSFLVRKLDELVTSNAFWVATVIYFY